MFEFIRNLQDGDNAQPTGDDLVIALCKKDVLLFNNSGEPEFPRWSEIRELDIPASDMPQIGILRGKRCFTVELENIPEILPENWQICSIRQFLFEHPGADQNALSRARGLSAWRKLHRFCGVCKSKLTASNHDSGMICPVCHAVYYPQLAPAVIVAITRNNGKEILLAHNRNFAGNIYSLIAGFVEAGESVENALHREVWEETSIRIKNLQYITSQMWPFPNSLMLAFRAEYDSGTAVPDGEELSDLGWFDAADLPELPAPGSVARLVIDQIINSR